MTPAPREHHPPRPGPAPVLDPAPRYGPRVTALAVAVASAWGVWALWRVFVATRRGQLAEDLAFEGARVAYRRLWVLAEPLLDVISTSFVAGGILAAVLVAVLRRRWALVIQVAVLVAGANVTTQVVKHQVLDRPAFLGGWQFADNTLPSGHTTAAASVVAALLLVVPRGWRPAVALGGAGYTAVIGVSTLVGRWHRPSDVVAGVLVVLAWGALVCAFTPVTGLDQPRRQGDRLATPGSTAVGALLLLAAAGFGVITTLALGGLAGYSWGLPTGGELTAYGGGVFAVLASSALGFGALLLIRQATSRQ